MSPAFSGGCRESYTIADNTLTTDEPDHARLRGIVDEVFAGDPCSRCNPAS